MITIKPNSYYKVVYKKPSQFVKNLVFINKTTDTMVYQYITIYGYTGSVITENTVRKIYTLKDSPFKSSLDHWNDNINKNKGDLIEVSEISEAEVLLELI